MIGIQEIVTAFPDKKIKVEDIPGTRDLSQAQKDYFNHVGIETVVAADHASGYDLAKEASFLLLEKVGIEASEIDFIILIQSRLPDFFMSSSGTRLQQELGANNAVTFSISDLGCVDMTLALKLAKDLLESNEMAENVMICYGNTPYSASRYRYPVTIYGDAGIALLIGREEKNQIIDITIQSSGAYWDLFKVQHKDRLYADYTEECSDTRKYAFELAVESKIRFTEINDNLLDRNEWRKEDVDHFLLQNISSRSYQFYESAFDIKLSQVCEFNLKQYGHLGPIDVMLNYQTGLEKGLFNPGDCVLIMNNSPVAAWSSMLLRV